MARHGDDGCAAGTHADDGDLIRDHGAEERPGFVSKASQRKRVDIIHGHDD
jgi:hypothetical protein